MKVTQVAVKDIYPIISTALEKRKAQYKKNIENFIRSRSEKLYDTVPISRMPFGADDINDYFKAINVSIQDINKCLRNTYYWNMNFNPRAAKDEFTMAMMMTIRYFVLNNDINTAEISSIYLAFSGKFYPSIHSQKFKIPPEKYRYVMEYVLNNVLTNKYDLKREGSVFGAVRSICKTWLNTYSDKMKNPDDEDVADMIQQLHGRIKSFLGNIAAAFYEAYEKKDLYFTYGSDSAEEDTYRIADNDSLIAERAVERAITWVTSKGVDYRLCKMSCDKNIKVDELSSIIESIQEDQANLPIIREFMQLLVVEYFATTGSEKDVTSYSFLAKSVIAKPNTKNKNIIRQKEIVGNWLNENSPAYRKKKTRATRSSYCKAVLIYYTLVIMQANK